MLLLDITAVLFFLSWIGIVIKRRRKNVYDYSYPPGPKRLPVIGCLLDMPGQFEWETAQKWGDTYGGLIYVENFGHKTIFINSYDIAADLLEKRGYNYSERPRLVMSNEMQGWGFLLGLKPYDHTLRRGRYVLRRFIQGSAVREYDQMLVQETRKVLYNIMQNPLSYAQNIRSLSASISMLIGYGYEIEPEKDPLIDLAEKGLAAVTDAIRVYYMVNFIPAMKYLPEWLPGCKFQKVAREGRQLASDVLHKPYAEAKDKIRGSSIPSIMSHLLDTNTMENGQIKHEEFIEGCVATVYAAGSDTTVSSNMTFILAMVLFPEAQRRGQEELDRVLGKGSLPTLEDRPNLPYINAMIKEVMRWHPVLPLGLPHCTTSADIYNGFYIPANTTILPNVWAMFRDPKVYPNPEIFSPERFLGEGDQVPLDPYKVAFGFGRRKCSGEILADNTIFISMASLLATFDFKKAIGDDGQPITPREDYTSNYVTHPLPFKCSIVPRSPEIVTLLEQIAASEK